jgi:hypothetical protein
MKRIWLMLLLLIALPALAAPPLASPKAKPHLVKATTCVVGAAGVTTMTLTITPPTLNTDGTTITLPLTYSVFLGTASGAETANGTGWVGSGTLTGLLPGKTYYAYVEALDANGASAQSAEVCKSITPTAPSIPKPPGLSAS